jgi:hypothetical protein
MPHPENRIRCCGEAGKWINIYLLKFVKIGNKLKSQDNKIRIPKIVFRIRHYKKELTTKFLFNTEIDSHWSTFMQLDMVVMPARIFSKSLLQQHLQRST